MVKRPPVVVCQESICGRVLEYADFCIFGVKQAYNKIAKIIIK